MFHSEKSENALVTFLHGTDFIQLNYCIFLLKLRPFKNYSSTFHIIAKHVDIYIFVEVCNFYYCITKLQVLLGILELCRDKSANYVLY